MSTQIDVVADAAGFAALEAEWNALAEGFPTPPHRFDWFEAARLANDRPFDLSVLVVRRAGEVRGIAPLMVDRSASVPVVRTLDDFTYEVNGFLYADDEALAALCRKVQGLRLPVMLRRLRAGVPEMGFLQATKPFASVSAVRSAAALGSVSTKAGWSALEAGMSSSSRTFMRRKRKIAERSGPVTFEAVAPDPSSVAGCLDELFRVESAGWKGTAGTSLLADSRMRGFVTALAHSSARNGTLRMFFLRIGEASAAARLTVLCGRRLWEIKIGYDERFQQCSPGILLMHETLRYACEQGLDGYEFLGSAETWHSHWPGETEPCVSFRSYPLSLGGVALLGLDAGQIAERRTRAALARRRSGAAGGSAGEGPGAPA